MSDDDPNWSLMTAKRKPARVVTDEEIRRSPVLQRLMREVAEDLQNVQPVGYNRVYHRHNR